MNVLVAHNRMTAERAAEVTRGYSLPAQAARFNALAIQKRCALLEQLHMSYGVDMPKDEFKRMLANVEIGVKLEMGNVGKKGRRKKQKVVVGRDENVDTGANDVEMVDDIEMEDDVEMEDIPSSAARGGCLQ